MQPDFDIDAMNDALLIGSVDGDVDDYNHRAWQTIVKISDGHNIGTNNEVLNQCLDAMRKNALSDNPKQFKRAYVVE